MAAEAATTWGVATTTWGLEAAAATAFVLAALLRPGGRDTVYEDGQDAVLLRRLREAGLITYPSPLLGGAAARGAARRLRGGGDGAALVVFGLPRTSGVARLQLAEFCTSVDRLAWAKANGCPWVVSDDDSRHLDRNPCAVAAGGGHLVLKWARQHGCEWDDQTYFNAAGGGHVEVLKWAWEHGCPSDDRRYVCDNAMRGGHLGVLKWALEHDCFWEDAYPDEMCQHAARTGHLEMLKWAREHDYPWGARTCTYAARGGHLEMLKWAREHDCPLDKPSCEYVSRNHPETLAWVQQQPYSP